MMHQHNKWDRSLSDLIDPSILSYKYLFSEAVVKGTIFSYISNL